MKELEERPEAVPIGAAPGVASGQPAPVLAAAATGAAGVLRLQRAAGNSATVRLLAREPAPEDRIIRGQAAGMVAGEEPVPVYAAADSTAAPVGQLAPGVQVKLVATAGDFYVAEIDGKRRYVRQFDLASAVDRPSAASQAEWERRAGEINKKLDESGHKLGKALRGGGTAPTEGGSETGFPKWFMELQWRVSMTDEWTDVEEEAQHFLRDYATWYMEMWHGGTLPPNLRVMFEYIGRSSINAAKASLGKYKSAAHFGGGLKADKKPTTNWCTQTSTTAATDALKQIGSNLGLDDLSKQKLPDGRTAISGEAAFAAPLMPGDMVFYLFGGAQYGGHAVTVIDDLGDSFTHISGNTGDAITVGIGEAKRLKHPPKPLGGKETFVLGNCNRVGTAEERAESTKYIARFNWEGKVLVYSIVRYGRVLEQVETAKAAKAAEAAAAAG